MFSSPAIVLYASLSMMTQTTGKSASIAVATTDGFALKPPSPTSDTAARSGSRHLDAEHGRGPEAHRREAARSDERAGNRDWELLRDTVLVPADVGDEEAVFGECAAQVAEDALRAHRKLIRLPLVVVVRRKLPAASLDVFAERAAMIVLAATRRTREHAQRGFGIGNDAELRGIVPADFRRIDVDVHEAGRRDCKRESRIPRARVGFRQPCSDRQDQISPPARIVRDRQTPEARLAEQQRVGSCRQPLPINVWATGTSRASASAVSSAVARDDSTPPPA